MRWVLALLMSATPAWPATTVQQIVLYKNAQSPLVGNPAPDWLPWSDAYTAQTFYVPFDALKVGGAAVEWASLLVVFQAVSPWFDVGVGMFACPGSGAATSVDLSTVCPHWFYFAANDSAFAPYTPGCAGTGPGPHPCRMDVTATFNTMIREGVPLYLTTGTFGNGTNGPNVYDVELEVMWR